MDNLIEAAARAGARLVVLDNIYMLGRPGTRPFDEDTPPNPCSRKGRIRARATERLFEAHARGDVQATVGQASDFYGPGATKTLFGDQFWPQALAGKKVWLPIDLDAIHTYHYIPDVAAGLAALGCAAADAYGRPWMLPCAPAVSTRENHCPALEHPRPRNRARRSAPLGRQGGGCRLAASAGGRRNAVPMGRAVHHQRSTLS